MLAAGDQVPEDPEVVVEVEEPVLEPQTAVAVAPGMPVDAVRVARLRVQRASGLLVRPGGVADHVARLRRVRAEVVQRQLRGLGDDRAVRAPEDVRRGVRPDRGGVREVRLLGVVDESRDVPSSSARVGHEIRTVPEA